MLEMQSLMQVYKRAGIHEQMAFSNRIGGLIRQSIYKNSSYSGLPPVMPMLNVIRHMSEKAISDDPSKSAGATWKIWSRRSCIIPEFVGRTVLIHNGRSFVRCKITEGKVGHKFGEFAFTRKRDPHAKWRNAAAKGGKGGKGGKTKK
ncbi:hypothetical protein QJS10_CPA16g00893 [Acorus calamus]|uniref:Ribosomal protein S19 n=1 Tax=Acorus calamus TaxID=4465 RepID=A0AAV9D576_ACOCL|nr:hypothetical protein QJS10_CPA16g00893 [Acorus calamus]